MEGELKKLVKSIADLKTSNAASLEKLDQSIKTVDLKVTNIESRLDGFHTRLQSLETSRDNNDTKITRHEEEIGKNATAITEFETRLQSLTKDNEKLAAALDDSIDRGMRETLIITGIPGNERSWDETKRMLAKYLEELEYEGNTSNDDCYSYEDFMNSIVRAHRDTNKNSKDPSKIFVKFNNNEVCDHVRNLKFKRLKTGLYFNQMRSAMVNERLHAGRKVLKTLKANEGKHWKMYVCEQSVRLMVKKAGENRYSCYKSF